jgi:hypothetical protein
MGGGADEGALTARLATGLWVQAYLWRAQAAGLAVYVVARGDPTAGAVAVKCATLDGQAVAFQRVLDPATGARVWARFTEGSEAAVDAALDRARRRDPDLWIIAVEDRAGRTLLDEPGLGD